MFKKRLVSLLMALLLLPQILLGGNASPISGSLRTFSEIFVLRSMRQIHSAQATYQATFGNGNFGSFQNLYQAGFIDEALASGSKYGYSYIVTVTPLIPGTTPSSFKVTATPRAYRKTGVRSFYIDVFGEMRGGDRNGQPATADDPFIDDCTNGSIVDNERCTTQSLRTLHGAESSYQATSGNGNFASLTQLGDARLISRTLATGLIHGYSFTVTFVLQAPNVPASFRITAVPQTYGTTGIRSFFVGTDGVMRGADRNGGPADENDPPVDFCADSGPAGNEQCSLSAMRTLHGAQMTYTATTGNGNFASLSQLAKAALINQSLADGIDHGYSYTVMIISPSGTTPAAFKISAVPVTYRSSGIRSFFIGIDGVLRGGDKNGLPADENDPPINQ